ncbi:hypothetical protein [Phytoactinopolyspora endophytica]|uniref:hypothetical protein n=1 Tax=Phytoactinopolyspora endophytica TaxID=1642495 RepID=UPI00101D1180|nr:hypothetical protein [Phytoactinopolyspora endophytica]
MTPADRHPPEYVLAELAEGVLEDDASMVSEHVHGCASCQSVVSRLTEVTGLLRAAPDRLPMPSHISERINAALTEEAIVATAARERDEQQASVTDSQASSGPVAWFRRRMPVALAAAAATALVGLVGYSLVNDDSPPDMTTSGGNMPDEESDDADTDVDEDRGESDTAVGAPPNEDDEAEEDAGAAEDDQGAAEPEAFSENMLAQAVIDVWEQRDEVEPGCGQVLASERGADLAGSAELGGEILVVLEDDEDLTGWIVNECGSAPGHETPDVAVAHPEQ